MKKVVVITGTSSGLGQSLAIKLARGGNIVYATMRNLDKQHGLRALCDKEKLNLSIKELDVTNPLSVASCFGEIFSEAERIDCLINNAGAGFVRTTEQANEDEIAWVMNINFMGMVRCVKAVLPSMRERREGHIINVTSVGGLVGQPFNEFYCAAKFATEGYTESMASYIGPNFNINFTAVEPGGIRTEFANNVFAWMNQNGGIKEDEYAPILERYLRKPREDGVYQSADEVADIIVQCVESKNPPIRVRTSPWANELCELKTRPDPFGYLQQEKVASMFL